MGKTCYERVKAAVDDNKPLSDKERCFCYLSVDAATASAMQCRTMAANTYDGTGVRLMLGWCDTVRNREPREV